MGEVRTRVARAIICEDIRAEISGSFSLVGVTSGIMHFSAQGKTDELPSADLAFYIECEVYDAALVEFRFVAPDKKTVLRKSSGKFEPNDDVKKMIVSPVPLEKSTFNFNAPGRYTLEGKVGDGDWEVLNFLDVAIEIKGS